MMAHTQAPWLVSLDVDGWFYSHHCGGDFSSSVGQVTMAVRIRGAGSTVGLDGSLFVGIPVRLRFVRLRVA